MNGGGCKRGLPVGPVVAEADRQEVPHMVLSLRAGLTESFIARASSRGGAVSCVAADRLAVALGLHPASLWGDLWWSHRCPPPSTPELAATVAGLRARGWRWDDVADAAGVGVHHARSLCRKAAEGAA